jgi:hypothetical protein
MHAENSRGSLLGNEMAPQTVALLHGLKAVYSPMQVSFDRKLEGTTWEKYLNPSPKGESWTTEETPFSSGREGRFDGSTWGYRAKPPMRLYNNWLGCEDSGIGGFEVCLFHLLTLWLTDYEEVGEDTRQGLLATSAIASDQGCSQAPTSSIFNIRGLISAKPEFFSVYVKLFPFCGFRSMAFETGLGNQMQNEQKGRHTAI